MSYLHNPSWAWHVPYAEYRAECHLKHIRHEELDRDFRRANPLDDGPQTEAMIKAIYDYAKTHEFDSEASVTAMFTNVAAPLTPIVHMDITTENVYSLFTKMRSEFYYFREFLDFPGIRLADDKKHIYAEREYFDDLGGKKECWLYKRFRLFGFSYYEELRFVIIQKKIGGPPEYCTYHNWYYIKGRNSDVGEEMIEVNDLIAYPD